MLHEKPPYALVMFPQDSYKVNKRLIDVVVGLILVEIIYEGNKKITLFEKLGS